MFGKHSINTRASCARELELNLWSGKSYKRSATTQVAVLPWRNVLEMSTTNSLHATA